MTDITGDGVPEVLLTYGFAGGSNFRFRPQVFQWRADDFRLIFAAELVSWAGTSSMALEPDPASAGRKQITLSYPYFYAGLFDHKMVNHPLGRQVWRWNADAGRFVFVQETVDMEHSGWEGVSPPQPPSIGDQLQWLANEGERAFRIGEYEKALGWHNKALRLAGSDWRPEHEKQPDWKAYIAFRRVETLLLMGQPDHDAPAGYSANGRAAMRSIATQLRGDKLGDLAQAFLEGYGNGTDVDAVARGVATMQKVDLYSHFYYEHPGALRFPMDAGILYPGAGLAAFLNAHPSLTNDLAGLRAGLVGLGFAVENVTLVEEGSISVTLRLPDGPATHGAFVPWPLMRESGWHVMVKKPAPKEWSIVGWITQD